MKVIIATGNRHKVAELSELFAPYNNKGYEFVSMRDAGFTGDIVEDADTFEGNALIKARTVCEATGCIAIADDSGLCVDALDGKPGVFSARYAGELADDGRNNAKLLAELRGEAYRAVLLCHSGSVSRWENGCRTRRMRGKNRL